jgi:hypothetical protein
MYLLLVIFNCSTLNMQCIVHVHVDVLRLWSLVLWDVAPCSHVEADRRFRGAYFLDHHCDVLTSESSFYSNDTTQRYISEDSKLHNRRRENLKSHIVRLCLWTAVVHSLGDICVWWATFEWYWQRKTEELGEKPVPVPLRPQIWYRLTRSRTQAYTVRGRLLTAWARPLISN